MWRVLEKTLHTTHRRFLPCALSGALPTSRFPPRAHRPRTYPRAVRLPPLRYACAFEKRCGGSKTLHTTHRRFLLCAFLRTLPAYRFLPRARCPHTYPHAVRL